MNLKTLALSGLALLCLNGKEAQAKKNIPVLKKNVSHSSRLSLEQHIAKAQKIAKQLTQNTQKFSSPYAKTTATSSRIVAFANRVLDGSSMLLIDTAKLYYTGERGGDMKSDFVKFDSAVSLTFDETLAALRKDYRQTQTFDAINNIISDKGQVWDAATLSYENESQSFYTSTAAKKVATDSSQDWVGSAWENSSKRIVKYDASNNIVSDTNFDWDGSEWTANAVYTYTYTAAKKVATMNVYLNVSSVWLNAYSIAYTYDASGFLIQDLSKLLNFTTMSLENSNKNTYTNDAAGNPTTQLVEEWNSMDMVWEKTFKYLNQFDAAKNNIVTIEQMWNMTDSKFDTTTRTTSTYNTYNQVTTESIADWDAATASWDMNDSTTYYYQDYTTTAIKEDVTAKADFKVYPIPANDALTVMASVGTTQNVQISLLDIQGRSVLSQSVSDAQQLNQRISVSNIPSGNYLLQLKGDKGLNMVKQISIAH